MKYKFRITAFILTLAITFIAHPFSILKANSYIYNGTFTGGRYDRYTYTGSDTIYMQIDGTTIQGNSITLFNVYFDEYYTGTFRISFGGYFRPDAFNIYVKGGIIDSVTSKTSTSGYYTISFENTNYVTVTLSTYNEIDNKEPSIGTFSLTTASGSSESTLNSIDISLSDAAYTLQQILTILGTPGDVTILEYLNDINTYLSSIETSNTTLINLLETIVNFNELNIGFFNYKENFSRVDDNHILYEYETESLGDNYFMYRQSSNRSIQRINIDYETNNYTNGNYYVYNLYFLSQSVMDSTAFDNLRIYTRDYVSSMNVRLYDFKLYLHYFTHSSGKSIFNLTIYEPISELSEYRDSRFQIDFQNFDVDASTVKFAYLGVVDSLPDETPYNYSQSTTEQSLEQTASDINDVANQSNEIEQQYVSDLTDFKNNLDLSDYDFSLHSNSGFTYLKEKLQDIYEINEFKPFYLVPIIFMILTVILGG